MRKDTTLSRACASASKSAPSQSDLTMDPVASLCESHAELMAEDDSMQTLALVPQIEGLLAQGREDLVWAAAQRIQTQVARADDFLHWARTAACSVTRGGFTQTLFAVPIVLGCRPRGNERRACGPIVAKVLEERDPGHHTLKFQLAPALIRHDVVSQWGLSDMHALRCAFTSDAWESECLQMLDGDAKPGHAWTAQVVGEPCHLYWVIGLCSFDAQSQPDWLGGEPDGGYGSFMSKASNRLREELGMSVDVGRPGRLATQSKEAPFNEAANGMLVAFDSAQHVLNDASLMVARLLMIDDRPMTPQGHVLVPCALKSRSRVLLELVLKKDPSVRFCVFEFSCETLAALEGIHDLTRVIQEQTSISAFEFVGHDERGRVLNHPGFVIDDDALLPDESGDEWDVHHMGSPSSVLSHQTNTTFFH